MQDEAGRTYCDQCNRRCMAGAIIAKVHGDIDARQLKGGDNHFCSSRCLRNRMVGTRRPDGDPVEALQWQLDQSRRDAERCQERLHEHRDLLRKIQDVFDTVEEFKLLDVLPPGEQGDRLRRSLTNMQRIMEGRWP